METKVNNSVGSNKTCNALSKRAACFFTPAGNGKNVPVYELVNGISRQKVVDGVAVTESLYDKIQMCKDVNDYKKFLEANNGNLAKAEEFYGKPADADYFDSTQFGDSHSVLNAQARVKSRYPNDNIAGIRAKYDQFVKEMQAKVEEIKKQEAERLAQLQKGEQKNEK